MKQYRISRKNLPVTAENGICFVWLFLLTKQVCEVPLWLEVPFWILVTLWFVGFFSLLKDSVEIDIFEKWNKK